MRHGKEAKGLMAGTKTSGKNTTKKGQKTSGTKKTNRTQVQKQEEGFLRSEVLIIVSFAFSVLLFLSNFRLCGIAGDYLRMAQLGIFGMIGFVVPVILFVGTCFGLANQGNPIATLKLVSVILAVIVLCGLAEMFFGEGFKEEQKAMEAFFRSRENGAGGGFVGGLLVMLLGSVFGTIGTYLVLLVLLVICGVCITERSLVALVKKGGGKAYQYAREDVARKRVIHEERKEERKRLKEEQKLRGVNLSSTKLDAWTEDSNLPEADEDYDRYEDYGDYDSYDNYDNYDNYDTRDESPVYDEPSVTGHQTQAARYSQESEKTVSSADFFTGTINRGDSGNDQKLHVQRDMRTLGEMEITDNYCVPWNTKTEDAGEEYEEDSLQASEFDDWAGKFRKADAEEEYEFSQPDEFYEDETDEALAKEPGGYEADEQLYGTSESYELDEPYGTGESYELDGQPYGTNESYEPDGAYEDEEEEEAYDSRTLSEMNRAGVGSAGEFSIPQESRRVVTSTGKIIESDTEALKKKLEKRREEAVEAGDVVIPSQLKEEMQIRKEYQFPSVELLKKGKVSSNSASDQEYRETAIKLQQTLRNFGVGVTVTNVSCGPSVTRYELHPEQGVKVSKIVGLADDIKLNLAAADIRIEAPIPGKSAVGIEVPNKENHVVYLRELLESEEFQNHKSKLAFAVGKDIGGQVVVTDVAKMPHLLIAGATGSGKSVCINTLIMSLIYKSDPNEVKMIMIDPKVVELSAYNGIPHLLIPVVTDPKKASGALNWAVAEMMDRYQKFAQYNVRNLQGYNAKIDGLKDIEDDNKPQKMPLIVIIVDELADLMMVAPGEVEDAICRLAQLARAAGIHLVIATQRPSVNVITGLIKANVPSRIAFSVSSGVDSRTIIDMYGAEKLLGKGDMLFYPSGYQKPQRVQGAFVSDQEVSGVVDFLTAQNAEPMYQKEIESQIAAPMFAGAAEPKGSGRDEYFAQAGKFIIEKEKGSIGMLQRMFKIGFNRAARIMDQLAEAGVVGEEEGTKPRRVLMTLEEFQEMLNQES